MPDVTRQDIREMDLATMLAGARVMKSIYLYTSGEHHDKAAEVLGWIEEELNERIAAEND